MVPEQQALCAPLCSVQTSADYVLAMQYWNTFESLIHIAQFAQVMPSDLE